MLLLHSLGGTTAHWAPQLEHLRPGRRAVALELRGHGGSEPPRDGDYSIDGYAADVAAAADTLELDCFVLAGHSMGAAVAAAYAASHPARVAGLVLVDGAFAFAEPSAEERVWLRELTTDRYQELIDAHWTTILANAAPAVRERVTTDLHQTPRETVARSFARLAAHDPIPAVRAYPGPKWLVLTDIGDNPLAAHRHLPDLPHTFIRGTGHWVQLDRPGELNAGLDAFLAKPELGCGRRPRSGLP